MLAVGSFILVLFLSLAVVRVASVALTLTGMSVEAARFQARSAWTGTGFTTGESEAVVSHPVRRQIITYLMVIRGAGLVTAATTLVLSFTGEHSTGSQLTKFGVILASVLVLWLVAQSKTVERVLDRVIRRALKKATNIDVRDYASVFHLRGAYSVNELEVEPDDWIEGRTLAELALPMEGVLVLGIEKPGGGFIGAPRGRTKIDAGDVLVLYGRDDLVRDLDERKKDLRGQAARYKAMAEQKRLEKEEAERAEQIAEAKQKLQDAQQEFQHETQQDADQGVVPPEGAGEESPEEDPGPKAGA